MPDVSADALDEALREVAAAARRTGVVTIVGAERPTPAGREIVSIVFGADGSRLGEQAKTQIDPTEEAHYVPGTGRRVFTAAGVTFGIAICHEAFRYPEIVALARPRRRAGDLRPALRDRPTTARCRPAGAMRRTRTTRRRSCCRALENTVFVAASNVAGPDQGSVTGVIAPDGTLVASLDYGVVGVVAADIDLALATRLLALRWAPERSVVA